MTRFQEQLDKIASIQRNAGWSEESITSYAKEVSIFSEGVEEGYLTLGAGLAQDNTRHGVPNKKRN